MTSDFDKVVWSAFERSTLVRAIERVARAILLAAAHSRVVASGRAWVRGAASRPGPVVLSATLTHVVLMAVIARPVSWQWAVLPSIAALVGVVLIACSRPRMEQ